MPIADGVDVRNTKMENLIVIVHIRSYTINQETEKKALGTWA